MAADDIPSSEYETSGVSGSTESLDLSCIHWGYLNCTLVTDPKRIKENVWQTYWVDLCGSTIRLYRDLSLPPNSACQLPPSSLIGPSIENEKKEAFIVLKKGTEVAIVEPEIEPYKSRKKLRVNKRHAFKVSFASKGNSHPAYVFQAPSKGSMYRWISKIEEGIDLADKPQNESATEKKLKEAKLFSMEQRRFNTAPKLRYVDKDDVDSGMEGDVEEIYEVSKKTSEELRLEDLTKRLQEKEQHLRQLDLEERAFLGPESSNLVKRCEFKSKTGKDYYLIPGYKRTLIPKGSELTILGQFSNNWWRCFVELQQNTLAGFSNGYHSETSSLVESTSSFDISDDNNSDTTPKTETLIGSVPTSILVELRLSMSPKLAMKYDDGTPFGSPEETPLPSPPLSPYSPHKSDRDSMPNRSSLRRSIASENLSEHDVWEQFCIPSPPSSPVTSRSTSPSLTPSASPAGSLEALDFSEDTTREATRTEVEKTEGFTQVKLRSNRRKNQRGNELSTKSNREAILMDDTVETFSEPELDSDRLVTVIDVPPPDEMPSALEKVTQETVKMRVKPRLSPEGTTTGQLPPRNYAFLVTKKLRQRGISLIVGSSSSEDEDEDGEGTGFSSKISRRKLDTEFMTYEGEAREKVRPYSAFVSGKQPGITLAARSSNFVPRTSTKDELLRDYSSATQKTPVVRRTSTCTTIKKLADWSSAENAPRINQRRTLQMSKASSEGFGFTLQTYGITQQEGQVEYMTFVLTVQEDGPAYMAGLRPGDIILEVDGENVEDADHKDVVSLIQRATVSVRLVVVFVDALRRMKLNTRLKILTAKLNDKNAEFAELCKKEEEVLKGRGGDSLNLSTVELIPNHERSGPHLYTTELTTSFTRETPEVHDSLHKYRQTGHDKPRPTSLPDQSELNQRCIVATTGSEILRNFASPDTSVQRRTLSTRLIKTFSKKRKSVESFKSYLDSDAVDRDKAEETGSDTSSLSSTSGVCESPVTAAEPTLAVSTAVDGKTVIHDPSLPQASPVNVSVAFNPDEVTEVPKNNSPILRLGIDNSEITNGNRVSPGIPLMHRRMEKSATARNQSSTSSRPTMPLKEKLKESSLPSQALIGPQFQKARSSSRPDSYLLAMDAAGEQPFIPNQERNKNANMILYESGT